MSDDDFTIVEVVCTGACVLEGGTLGQGFIILKDGELGDSIAFPRRKTAGNVGNVYRIPNSQDGVKWRMGEIKWARVWEDSAKILEWKADEESILTNERAAKRLKDGEAQTLKTAMKGLEPLRRAYFKTDRRGKLAIEVLALEYLRSWAPD